MNLSLSLSLSLIIRNWRPISEINNHLEALKNPNWHSLIGSHQWECSNFNVEGNHLTQRIKEIFSYMESLCCKDNGMGSKLWFQIEVLNLKLCFAKVACAINYIFPQGPMRGKKLTDSIKLWFSLVLDINPTQSEQKKAIKNFAHIHIYATLTRLSLTCHEITVLNP